MKKFIITAITIVIVVFAIALFRGMFLMNKVNNQPLSYTPKYKYVENLNGIGRLKIGMTSSEVKRRLDSVYLDHHGLINKKRLSVVDSIGIKYAKIFELVKPYKEEMPLEYYPNYREYRAQLILSEDFIVNEVELYFWSDTLYRIHFPNSKFETKQVGEGLLYKYGDGIGHNKKDGNNEDQLHRWGNDRCIVTYIGKTTYYSDGPRWFHDVEVITQDLNLTDKIETYLDNAEDAWQSEKNAAKYKNL